MKEEKIVCSGKTVFPFIMGLFFWGVGVVAFFIILTSTAAYEVKGIFSIFLILCGLEGSYFLLFWHNKQIVFTRNEIIYHSIFGIEKKYSWEDVKTVCYKSSGRGAYRILIQTDKKIYVETGMMKNCEAAEKLIKEKSQMYKIHLRMNEGNDE